MNFWEDTNGFHEVVRDDDLGYVVLTTDFNPGGGVQCYYSAQRKRDNARRRFDEHHEVTVFLLQ